MKAGGPTSTNEPFIRLSYPNAFGYYNHGGSGQGILVDSGASIADLKTCSVLTREGGTNGNGGNRTMRVDVSDGRSGVATPTVQNWSSASGTTFGIGYFDPTYTAS